MGCEPLISIMMPCFNAERTRPMALASLRAQTYENWEALVVDDGSSDAAFSRRSVTLGSDSSASVKTRVEGRPESAV